MAPSVIYFGLRFSQKGLQPTDEKVNAIKDAPTPHNVTELRSFLGMVAALTNFIPKFSTLAHPLYELLGNKPWNWTAICEPSMMLNVRSHLRLCWHTTVPVSRWNYRSTPPHKVWVPSSCTCIPMAHDAQLPMHHEH